MVKIELTKEQIEQLLNMVKNASFRGDGAEKVMMLIKALEGGLENV